MRFRHTCRLSTKRLMCTPRVSAATLAANATDATVACWLPSERWTVIGYRSPKRPLRQVAARSRAVQPGRPEGRRRGSERAGQRTNSSEFTSVDAATGAGLTDDDLRQLRDGRLEFVPDPASDVLARRVLKTLDLVQIVVVEATKKRLEVRLEVGEVHEPAALGLDWPRNVQCDVERMPVESAALVALGDVRKEVRCLERELLEDLGGCDRADN